MYFFIVFDITEDVGAFNGALQTDMRDCSDILTLIDAITETISQRIGNVSWHARQYAALQVMCYQIPGSFMVWYDAYLILHKCLLQRYSPWLSDAEVHMRVDAYVAATNELKVEIW